MLEGAHGKGLARRSRQKREPAGLATAAGGHCHRPQWATRLPRRQLPPPHPGDQGHGQAWPFPPASPAGESPPGAGWHPTGPGPPGGPQEPTPPPSLTLPQQEDAHVPLHGGTAAAAPGAAAAATVPPPLPATPASGGAERRGQSSAPCRRAALPDLLPSAFDVLLTRNKKKQTKGKKKKN